MNLQVFLDYFLIMMSLIINQKKKKQQSSHQSWDETKQLKNNTFKQSK